MTDRYFWRESTSSGEHGKYYLEDRDDKLAPLAVYQIGAGLFLTTEGRQALAGVLNDWAGRQEAAESPPADRPCNCEQAVLQQKEIRSLETQLRVAASTATQWHKAADAAAVERDEARAEVERWRTLAMVQSDQIEALTLDISAYKRDSDRLPAWIRPVTRALPDAICQSPVCTKPLCAAVHGLTKEQYRQCLEEP